MGQRTTKLGGWKRNESTTAPTDDKPTTNKKYPLPLEVLMLRKIKNKYDTSGGSSPSANGNANHESETTKRADSGNPMPMHSSMSLSEEKCSIIEYDAPDEYTISTVVENNEDGNFSLIDFPILVVENIINHLIPSSILALRATCKTTKNWIDYDTATLAGFKLRISPEMCDYERAPCTGQWSNFALPYICLNSNLIEDLIENYSTIIWSLEIYAPKTFNNSVVVNYPYQDRRRLFQILYRCSHLTYLNLCRLDSLCYLGNEELPSLRVLSIDRVQWMKDSDFMLFENLIMKCPNLEYLKIPQFEILGSLAFMFYDTSQQPEVQHLVTPLIKYLDRYRLNSCHKTRFYIDVVEFEDFKLCSSASFYALSRKCVTCNAVLMNVYFVPRDAVLRNEQNIVESFASMFGFIKIDFDAELWKHLEVMECWIEDYPDNVELTVRQLSFLRTIPKIKTLRSLTIRLSVEDPDICTAALEACVGQDFVGVHKLIIRRHHVQPDRFVAIPPGFGHAFRNLKNLYLQEMDSRDEDFCRLWPWLPNLVELFIYKCPYLTQEAFLQVGTSEPTILKLAKLQFLVIFLHDGISGFNDDFLRKALQFMRLKGFALRGVSGVEFTEEGMMSLLNSPFHETVEDFEAPSCLFRPGTCASYWQFYVALPKKELRQNRIWLSCSVLLNSLSSSKHRYDFKQKCLGI